tara:strand:- start:13 stop:267 length:255 start_codon:yes stop_codon:yes gene_type:complete
MNNYLNTIKEKVKKNINLEQIEVIDNSSKHKTHKFYDKNKYHILLEIESKYLSTLTRINAQKIIMKILADDIKNKIHAIQINIK